MIVPELYYRLVSNKFGMYCVYINVCWQTGLFIQVLSILNNNERDSQRRTLNEISFATEAHNPSDCRYFPFNPCKVNLCPLKIVIPFNLNFALRYQKGSTNNNSEKVSKLMKQMVFILSI